MSISRTQSEVITNDRFETTRPKRMRPRPVLHVVRPRSRPRPITVRPRPKKAGLDVALVSRP